MRRRPSSERGQVLVIIVLTMFGLVGITGLAIDGSRAYSDRRQAQNAADTAVLAVALSKIRNPDGNWKDVAYPRAESNGYDNNGSSNTVTVYYPPEEPNYYAGDGNYVQVIIESRLDTLFGRVIGIEQVTNTVEAVARVEPSVPTSLYDGNAVVGLAPHACQAVKWQGAAGGEITGGGIFVNSDCDNGAFFNQSCAAKLVAPSITVVGNIKGNCEPDVPSITQDSPYSAMAYPPTEYIYPYPAECTDDVEIINGGTTLKPGIWPPDGWSGSKTFPPSDVEFLESGVYCLDDGDFRLNSTGDYLEGHEVLIWVDKGEVLLNGGTFKLDGPKSGIYQGLVIYLPITNNSPVTINGNVHSGFEGTLLAPASIVDIQGTGTVGITGQIIGYRVLLGGTSNVKIHYDDTKVWHALSTPSIELKH